MAKSSSRREQRQKARRLGLLTDAQAALGWFIILALCALIGAVYVSQASRIAYTGRQVQIRQDELEQLKRETAALERQIAGSQSLERLESGAKQLGFVRATPENIEYIVVGNVPALISYKPAVETGPPPVQAPIETVGEAVWFAVKGSVSDLVRGESSE